MRSYLCAFLYSVLPIFSASQDQIFGKISDFWKTSTITLCPTETAFAILGIFSRTHFLFPERFETRLITQHDIFLDSGGADKSLDTGGADKVTDRRIRYILLGGHRSCQICSHVGNLQIQTLHSPWWDRLDRKKRSQQKFDQDKSIAIFWIPSVQLLEEMKF